MAQKVGRYVNPTFRALKVLGGSARPAEVYKEVARDLGLTDDSPELHETLKSGGSRFENRIQFVRLYLALAGYIDRSKHGVWSLTDKGRASEGFTDDEVHLLLLDIQRQGTKNRNEADDQPEPDDEAADPQEQLPQATPDYKDQLLSLLRGLPPAGFEQMCQRLLRESGACFVTGVDGGRGRSEHTGRHGGPPCPAWPESGS